MNNKIKIVIGVLVLIIVLLLGYILFDNKKEQVSTIEKNMEVEVPGQKEPEPYPYVLNKVYTYSIRGAEKQATFLGYEKDGDSGAQGYAKFALSDGGTAYFFGTFRTQLKQSGLLNDLAELNKKYNSSFSDGSYREGTMYNIKPDPTKNLFEVFDAYQQSGIFDYLEPDFNNPGYGI